MILRQLNSLLSLLQILLLLRLLNLIFHLLNFPIFFYADPFFLKLIDHKLLMLDVVLELVYRTGVHRVYDVSLLVLFPEPLV